MDRIFFLFLSGIVAIFTYLFVVGIFLWHFYASKDSPKQYTTYKETSFNVALIEEKKEAPKKVNQTQKNKEKEKIKEIPIKKENASKTANVGLGINKLFQQVETKREVPKEALKPQSQNDKIARRKKALESMQKREDNLKENIEKIVSNLEIKKTMGFLTPKGEYDEFYAKVQEILYENWNPIQTQNENQSEIQITIDWQGKFSYKVIKLSGNLEFDKALQEFLDIMQNKEFPKYEGGDLTNIIVTFKTEV